MQRRRDLAAARVAGKRYEVWLTNDRRTTMQPIGWIGTNGTATMTVPADADAAQYGDIEVSVQNVDAHALHVQRRPACCAARTLSQAAR